MLCRQTLDRAEQSNSYSGQFISVEGIIGQRLGEYYNWSEHNRNLRFSKMYLSKKCKYETWALYRFTPKNYTKLYIPVCTFP